MKTFLQSFRLLLILTALTGVVYPLSVWAVGQIFFRNAAEGSLVRRDGRIVGSALLAQKTTDPRYFWSRPSAGDYATVPSGASQQGWTSAKLVQAVTEAENAARAAHAVPTTVSVPPDLVTTSGSGLDPHLSPEAIRLQQERVARARELSLAAREQLEALIAQHVEGGRFTPRRVNVLQLNLALDSAYPVRE